MQAILRELEESFAEQDREFDRQAAAECAAHGHDWEVEPPDVENGPSFPEATCSRCGEER